MPSPVLIKVRIWDLPTRAFHWLLVIAVTGSVVSAKIGGNAMDWHFRFGYAVLALVVFRLVWGCVGGRWSRFSSFFYGPVTLLRYLRGGGRPDEHLDVGHSPSGALSVFAGLLIIGAQLVTGLVADDEIANLGPLNRWVSTETALSATSWHKQAGSWLLFGWAALHVAAIAWVRLRKRIDLVQPMVGGDKDLPPGTPASADGLGQRLLASALLAASIGLAVWVSMQAA